MKEDLSNLLQLNVLSFENSEREQKSILELLEKTGIILSSKKEKEFEEFLKINKDQEFNQVRCLSLFQEMIPENFDNLLTISEKPEDKKIILFFSKNIRKSIQSGKISKPLLQIFYELRNKICAKINYFIKMEKIYKMDHDNSKAFEDKNLQKFTRYVSEMNKEHTEAILLAALRKGKESVIYNQLVDVIKSKNIKQDDSIEFSIISRYDSCSRCEFTLAEIRELLDKIASENSSMQIFPSFINIKTYDKIREEDNERSFLRNDGINQHQVEIGINSKKILRQYESLQILFGNSGKFSYVVQSGEKGCVVKIERKGLLTKLNEKYLKILNKLPELFSNLEELGKIQTQLNGNKTQKKKAVVDNDKFLKCLNSLGEISGDREIEPMVDNVQRGKRVQKFQELYEIQIKKCLVISMKMDFNFWRKKSKRKR